MKMPKTRRQPEDRSRNGHVLIWDQVDIQESSHKGRGKFRVRLRLIPIWGPTVRIINTCSLDYFSRVGNNTVRLVGNHDLIIALTVKENWNFNRGLIWILIFAPFYSKKRCFFYQTMSHYWVHKLSTFL